MSEALLNAIIEGDLSGVIAELDRGADPNYRRVSTSASQLSCPLHAAVSELGAGGSVPLLLLLIRRGADVNTIDEASGSSALHLAVLENRAEARAILLAAGAEANIRARDGSTALQICVQRRDYVGAAELLMCGASVGIDDPAFSDVDMSGKSPLGLAVSLLDVALVELLLRHGASPDSKDADERRAGDHLPSAVRSQPEERARGAITTMLNLEVRSK